LKAPDALAGAPKWIPAAAAAELASRAGDGAAAVRVAVDTGAGPLRDAGSYLLLADRMYGRLRAGGLRRYAQLGGEQLQVAWEAEAERLAFELREPVEAVHGWRIALLWVALELLPEVVGAEVAVPWAAARRRMADDREHEEPQVTLFAGEDRNLRARAAERPLLAALSRDSRDALVEAVQDLYAEDSDLLPASIRFARERVIEVRLGG
jgi:hypothetical protein